MHLRLVVATLLWATVLSGCGSEEQSAGEAPATRAATPTPGPVLGPTPGPAETLTAIPTKTPTRQQRGIDASHHQGDIDWRRVEGDRIDFAYLKATEGSSFADPRFAHNWNAARAAGVRTGGYHYYTLCSPPQAQAEHFVATLASVPSGRSLPPVVDLELIGNCDPPPERGALRDDVRLFIDHVEDATNRKVVVYFHPDFESHYGLVEEFGRRLWVRRVGERPPPGDWWMWQRDDQGTVDGVEGPVDLNVRR